MKKINIEIIDNTAILDMLLFVSNIYCYIIFQLK